MGAKALPFNDCSIVIVPVAFMLIVPLIVTLAPGFMDVGVTLMVIVGTGNAVVTVTLARGETAAATVLLPAHDDWNV